MGKTDIRGAYQPVVMPEKRFVEEDEEEQQAPWPVSQRRARLCLSPWLMVHLLLLAANVGFLAGLTVWSGESRRCPATSLSSSSSSATSTATSRPLHHDDHHEHHHHAAGEEKFSSTKPQPMIDYSIDEIRETVPHTFLLETTYSGPPSAERDLTWETLLLEDVQPFAISAEHFASLNPSPETGVRIPDDEEGRYMAIFDVWHQLHCVNLLHQNLFPEHYAAYDAFHGPPGHLKGHLSHCLEQLRQSLMCSGDTGILTFNWLQGEERPQANFRTKHTCQNWDRLAGWSQRNNASMQLQNLRRPTNGPELEKVICEEGVDCPEGDY